MNLRAIANRATSAINPNLTVGWQAYAGYVTSPSGKITPSYAPSVPLIGQVQALTRAEVRHLDAMNLSPCDRAAYVNGQLSATSRTDGTGGDLLTFEGKTWKVMAILEGWSTAGWQKVALVEQMGA